MPKRIETPLTARQVATAKPGIHADGGNLYLRVRKSVTGSGRLNKAFVFRYGRGGRYFDMGLGSTDDITLAEARAKAKDLRRQLVEDIDPAQQRKKEREAALIKLPTFDECATDYIKAHESEWRGRGADAWRNSIKMYASDIVGTMRVADITADDVARVLRPIWDKIPNTASKLRGRVEKVLDYAKHKKFCTWAVNPATWRGGLALEF